jgi:hypothetical protein
MIITILPNSLPRSHELFIFILGTAMKTPTKLTLLPNNCSHVIYRITRFKIALVRLSLYVYSVHLKTHSHRNLHVATLLNFDVRENEKLS